MDATELGKVAVTAFLSSAGGIFVAVWKLSSQLAKIEAKQEEHTKDIEELKTETADIKTQREADRRELSQQWNSVERAMGRIEGSIDGRKR